MAAFIMESADIGAAYNTESLTGRLANGALAVRYALLCAIDVASTLRDLHQKGLAHGNVSTDSIRVSDNGAVLPPRGPRSRPKDCRSDVAAFGAVLYEMLTGTKPPSDLTPPAFTPIRGARDLHDVRSDALRLAGKCLEGWPKMKQVLIELRILGIVSQRLMKAPHRLRVVPKRPQPPVTSDLEDHQFDDALPVGTAEAPEVDNQAAGVFQNFGAKSPPVAPSHATIVCPKCSGEARFIAPRSLVDRFLNRFSHLRRCDLCGYRFIVVRYRGRRI